MFLDFIKWVRNDSCEWVWSHRLLRNEDANPKQITYGFSWCNVVWNIGQLMTDHVLLWTHTVFGAINHRWNLLSNVASPSKREKEPRRLRHLFRSSQDYFEHTFETGNQTYNWLLFLHPLCFPMTFIFIYFIYLFSLIHGIIILLSCVGKCKWNSSIASS